MYICLARLLPHFVGLCKILYIFQAKMLHTTLSPMEWGCLKTSFWSDILKNVVVRAKKPKKETIAQIASTAFTT